MTGDDGELQDLIGRTAGGDRAAFEALYRAASAKLFGIVLRIVRDRPLAEDVMQECWVRIWRNAGRYEAGSGRPATWMAAIARHAAIDAVRQRQVQVARVADDGDGDALAAVADPAGGADPMDRVALSRCLGELEEIQRRCITLAYLDGWSREDLAERFDRPVGTIKTWLHRGLARLKDCLDGP